MLGGLALFCFRYSCAGECLAQKDESWLCFTMASSRIVQDASLESKGLRRTSRPGPVPIQHRHRIVEEGEALLVDQNSLVTVLLLVRLGREGGGRAGNRCIKDLSSPACWRTIHAFRLVEQSRYESANTSALLQWLAVTCFSFAETLEH